MYRQTMYEAATGRGALTPQVRAGRPPSRGRGVPLLASSSPRAQAALALLILPIGLALGFAVAMPRTASSVLVVVVFLAMVTTATLSPTAGLVGAIVLGGTVGEVRRLIIYFIGDGELVSFLTIVPAMAIVAALLTAQLRAVRTSPPIRSAVPRLPRFYVAVLLAFVLGGLNPAGAGIVNNLLTSGVLLGGALAFIATFRGFVPVQPLLVALVIVGAANSLYFLNQEFNGITPWDQYWVDSKGYASLYIGPGLVRPLGLASSVAEGAGLCAVGGVIAAHYSIRRKNPLFGAIAILLLAGLLVTGIRTYFLLALVALVVSVASTRRRPIVSFIVLTIVVVPTIYLASGALLTSTSSAGAARIFQATSGNESAETSTVPIHIDLMVRSVVRGVSSVIGSGSGQIGLLTTEGLGSADTDLGNVALMAGILGIVACIWSWVYLFRNLGPVLRSTAGLSAALVTLSTITQWFTPSLYGLMPVVWACLGAVALEAERART